MIFFVWKRNRLARDFHYLVNTVQELSDWLSGFEVITGHGADSNTPTTSTKLDLEIFAFLMEIQTYENG